MATDMDEFYPFATGLGANVSEEEWREMAEDWLPTGVVAGEDSELAAVEHTPSAAASIDVSTGEVRIAGHVGIISAAKTLGIAANASGNPRIDLIVARAVFTAGSKKIELDVLQGVAAAAPVEPALTQNLTSMWEEPLAAIDVAAGFVTIVTADIRDRRNFTRMVPQLIVKEPVRVATTAALAASTVTGTTRVANANGALGAIDGVTLVAGDRLLDKNHATAAQRGIWRVVDPGSATRPWTLERPRDFDVTADVRAGCTVPVTEGTVGADQLWILTTNNPITLGTTGLAFAEVTMPVGVAAGDVVYFDGTRWVRLAVGADGTVMTLAAGLPSWAASTAGDPTEFIVGSGAFAAAGGTPAFAGPSAVYGWQLDPGASESVSGVMDSIPASWTTYCLEPIWANSGAGAGNVRLRVGYVYLADGVTVGALTTADATVAAGVTDNVKISNVSGTITPGADKGKPVYLVVARLGADGADTLANDIVLLGLRARKLT